MRLLLCLSVLLLAACSGQPTENQTADPHSNALAPWSNVLGAGDGNRPEPTPQPMPGPANSSADEQAPAPEPGGATGRRQQQCVAMFGPALPRGTDANAYCACLIRRAPGSDGMGGAVRQCSAEFGISTPRLSRPPVDTPEGREVADTVRRCTVAAARELPPGTNVTALCNCLIDGQLANPGGNSREVAQQCASRLGIRLPQR